MVCRLVGGSFATGLQVLVGAAAFASLAVKKLFDDRSFFVWTLDVSKQVVGDAVAHVANIGLSLWLTRDGADECVYYSANHVLDCTLGVFVEYSFLRCMSVATNNPVGCYFNELGWFDRVEYCKQMMIWLLAVLTMKVAITIVVSKTSVYDTWGAVLGGIEDGRLELAVVMLILPLLFNTIQAVVQDAILIYAPVVSTTLLDSPYEFIVKDLESEQSDR